MGYLRRCYWCRRWLTNNAGKHADENGRLERPHCDSDTCDWGRDCLVERGWREKTG